jgi:hypothetical protein
MRALLPLLVLAGCIEKLDPIDSDLPPDDSTPDTGEPPCTYYADTDGDGFGDPLAPFEDDCDESYVSDSTDCDDTDAAVHPGAAEVCNGGVDDDCDPDTDEDADLDGDGIGPCSGDCDDTDPAIFPGATEICNGVDDDCDPGTDERTDADLDRFSLCEGDCDDDDAQRSPLAMEIENDEDDDCDGVVDDGAVRCNLLVPDSYDTIGEAMAAAATATTICIGPGEYAERLTITEKEVQLVGVAGPVLTVIDGGGLGTVVEIALVGRLEATLAGLRLRDGQTGGDGGGVRVISGTAHLRSVVIEDCTAGSRGGGIAVQAGALDVTDSEVRDNSAYYAGGGIVVSGGGSLLLSGSSVADNEVTGGSGAVGGGLQADGANIVTIESSAFMGNAADRGGGIHVTDTPVCELTSTALLDNRATAYGGGLYVHEAPMVARQLWISGNDSTDWGGGIYSHGADLVFANVVVAGNSAARGAAGMEVFGGSLRLQHGLFARNTTPGSGAGLFLIDYAHAELESTIFLENTAGEGGGALHLYSATETAILDACDLWGDLPAETFGLGALSPAQDLAVEPGLLDVSGADPWDWDVHLATTSPLQDAGPDDEADPDLGPADLGPFGGPGGGLWDLDGDGYPAWWHPGPYDPEGDPFDGWDCDDHDAGVHPGAGCE